MSDPHCATNGDWDDEPEFGAHDQGFVQAHQEPRAICPDCVSGKHVNCLGDALDPVTDGIVACACDHAGGVS